MIEPQFSHDPFDALLADACRAAAREDLSRAGLRGRPAPRKLLRVLLIAALLAALLTFGVLASWPELRLRPAGDRLALSAVQGAEAAPARCRTACPFPRWRPATAPHRQRASARSRFSRTPIC